MVKAGLKRVARRKEEQLRQLQLQQQQLRQSQSVSNGVVMADVSNGNAGDANGNQDVDMVGVEDKGGGGGVQIKSEPMDYDNAGSTAQAVGNNAQVRSNCCVVWVFVLLVSNSTLQNPVNERVQTTFVLWGVMIKI